MKTVTKVPTPAIRIVIASISKIVLFWVVESLNVKAFLKLSNVKFFGQPIMLRPNSLVSLKEFIKIHANGKINEITKITKILRLSDSDQTASVFRKVNPDEQE